MYDFFKFSSAAILKMATILKIFDAFIQTAVSMFYLYTKFQSSSYFIVFIMNF